MSASSTTAAPSADLPGLLRVFADATRLRILALLAREELTAGELARCLDQAPSRVSNHLRVLREHDLLQERRVGTTIHLRGAGASGSALAAQLLETVLPSILSGPDHEADAGRLAQVLAARAVPEDFFDRVAGEYDKRGALFASGQARQRTVASLLQPGLVLADLGCGTGYMARALAPLASRLICVDQSEAMLAEAQENLRALPPTTAVEFRQGALDALPLDDASLDGAVMGMVLHHLEDAHGALVEVLRALRPGGTFAVLELAPHREAWVQETLGDRHLGLPTTEVVRTLERAGFQDVHVEPVDDRYCPRPGADEAPAALPLYIVRARKAPTP
ncbi:MAG: metalloregulator ArsR/SmtB family transcription factor [Planctomycetes bacterium]|nr:metalloregulator ArsR/SmtB family transcription factor [Planctomycetota bacterium]